MVELRLNAESRKDSWCDKPRPPRVFTCNITVSHFSAEQLSLSIKHSRLVFERLNINVWKRRVKFKLYNLFKKILLVSHYGHEYRIESPLALKSADSDM